jgi:hypothetical protein
MTDNVQPTFPDIPEGNYCGKCRFLCIRSEFFCLLFQEEITRCHEKEMGFVCHKNWKCIESGRIGWLNYIPKEEAGNAKAG